jgi:hypothetical protein
MVNIIPYLASIVNGNHVENIYIMVLLPEENKIIYDDEQTKTVIFYDLLQDALSIIFQALCR